MRFRTGATTSARRDVALDRHRRALRTVPSDAQAIRRQVVTAVREIGECDVGYAYSILAVGDGVRALPLDIQGPVDIMGFAAAHGSHPSPSSLSSLVPIAQSPPEQRRSFLELAVLGERDAFEASDYYGLLMEPRGLGDKIRMLCFHGDGFVAWIGGFRRKGSPAFGARERRRLAPLVAPVQAALSAADALERLALPDETAHVMLRPDGSVEHASRSGAVWLLRPGFGEALGAAVAAVERGEPLPPSILLDRAEARIVRLDGSGAVRYLITLCLARRIETHPCAGLTAAQRAVAQEAAWGATVEQIAGKLGCSGETVRSHLKRVYKRLDVSSRVELAKILSSGSKLQRALGR